MRGGLIKRITLFGLHFIHAAIQKCAVKLNTLAGFLEVPAPLRLLFHLNVSFSPTMGMRDTSGNVMRF